MATPCAKSLWLVVQSLLWGAIPTSLRSMQPYREPYQGHLSDVFVKKSNGLIETLSIICAVFSIFTGSLS